MQEKTDYIIALLKDKNSKGIELLLNRYQDYIYTIVFRVVKNTLVAEEVCQDVFMKIFHSIHKYDGKAKFTSWMYSIAYHAAIDAYRKKKHQFIPISNENQDKFMTVSTENKLNQANHREVIDLALEQLEPREASLITLFYFDEMTVKELSKILSETESNIKVKLFRVRKKLKKILERYLNQEIDTLYG